MYAQCDTGSEPECACTTAPVVCTVDLLDTYMFSMSPFQHPDDGPTPLCSGPGNGFSTPQNPTWFAFVAWCEDLTINVHPTNCQAVIGGFDGVQCAIYSDCNYTPVVCNVQIFDCNTNDKILVMDNLTIGNTYYFLIDGCAGAYCDIEIDVFGTCGLPIIAPWSMPIDGPTEVCSGTSPVFTIEDLDGAADYHWYIDGVLAIEGSELITFSELWDTPGVFELCVDASNDPCIPESDFPEPICITIEVFAAEAGTIDANPNPVCPNETISISVSGYNTDPSNHQFVVIADLNGTILQVVPGDAATWTYDMCGSFMAYSYNYHDNASTGDPIVGQDISTLDCGDGCCDQDEILLEFVDTEQPVFPIQPPDLSLTCIDLLMPMTDLEWTDNCDGSGMVSGVESGSADLCLGGVIMRQWDYADQCDNAVQYIQTITIDALQPPTFVDPPTDIVVECVDIPTSAPNLLVENVGSGLCQTMADIAAVQIGSADICGGDFSFEWQYTDACGTAIIHTQNVTVNEATEAVIDQAPADTTVMCDAIPLSHPTLNYSNGLLGACLIEGTIIPEIVNNASICGGEITRTWSLTDVCDRAQSVVQLITVEPAPEAVWVNPPADETIDCSALPSVIPPLSYTNGSAGTCEIAGTVNGVQTIYDLCQGEVEWQWEYTDICDRTITHTQHFTISPPPPVVFNNPPADITIDCGPLPPIPQLTYSNNTTGPCLISGTVPGSDAGVIDYCGGQITRTWMVTDPCGVDNMHTQIITVEPAPPAIFTNLPADVTLNCVDVPPGLPALNYSNSLTGLCAIDGAVVPGLFGSYDACGGNLIYQWTFIDNCGRSISHSQNVVVLPAPSAAFINPPMDAVMSCSEVPPNPPSLSFENGLSGSCSISGSVSGMSSGAYDACGGLVAFQWTFTDNCGITINHVQQITVTPASDPIWIDPPDDIVLGCDDTYETPDVLLYSNNENDPCDIAGTVDATVVVSGNDYIHTWSYIHPCSGDLFESQQIVSIIPPVDIEISPNVVILCEGESYDLSTIVVDELNGSNITVTFHSASPANASNELASPEISVFIDTEFVILGTSQFGCADEAIFEVIIETIPDAGDDIEIDVCQIESIDLYDYISTGASQDGYWLDVDGSGMDVSNPSYVTFNDIEPGTYILQYIVEGFICLADTSEMQITVSGPPEFSIDSVYCSGSNTTYTVSINGANLQVIASIGNVVVIGPNDIEVQDIPIDEVLSFDIWDIGPYCVYTYMINPPNCNCPTVPAPMNVGDVAVCEGDPIPNLVVTVGTDFIVNWYDAAIGGNVLVSASETYLPVVSIPGVYTYFAEAESVDFPGCVSPIRTPVVLQINASPIVNDIAIDFCDDAETGTVDVDFELWRADVTSNAAAVVTYYDNANDAMLGVNELLMPVVISIGSGQYFARVVDVNGCANVALIDVELFALPEFNTIVQGEVCLGDSNGVIQIDGPFPGLPYAVILDGISYMNIGTFSDLAPGDHDITVQWTPDTCASNQIINVPSGVELSIVVIELTCSDNGTNTDPADDFYYIEFSVTGGIGTFELLINGVLEGEYTYDVPHTISVPANDAAALFAAVDVLTGCNAELTTPDLITCSSNCDITVETFTQDCDDNGTPLDPTDDFHTFTMEVSAINGSVTNLYEMHFDGVLEQVFSYGQIVSFTVPVSGAPISIQLIDAVDPQCFENLIFTSILSCSNACLIDEPLVTYTCNDNGTPNDESDDDYTVSFTAIAINPGVSNIIEVEVDGVGILSVAPGSLVSFVLPADGNQHTITLTDADDITCTVTWETPVLFPCSSACILNVTIVEIYCDNAGTNQTDLDDLFYGILLVEGTNVDGAWEIVDPPFNGLIGIQDTIGPFLISNGNVVVLIDAVNGNCSESISLDPPSTCSTCSQTIDAGDDQFIDCGNPSVTLELTTSEDGDVFWTDPLGVISMGATLEANLAGTYIGTASFEDGCNLSDSVLVSSDPTLPTVSGGPDLVLNCEVSVVTITAQIVTGSGPFTYEWTDIYGSVISTASELTVSIPGSYFIQVNDIGVSCLSAIDEVQVMDITNVVSANIYSSPGSELTCLVNPIILYSENEANVEYVWTLNGVEYIGDSLLVSTAGEVVLTAMDTNSLCSDINSIEILEYDAPTSILAEVYPTNCLAVSDGMILIEGAVGGVGPYDFELNGLPVSEGLIEDLPIGNYSLTVIDINGCIYDTTVVVESGDEVFIIVEAFVELNEGENYTLIADVNITDSEIASVLWSPSSGLSCDTCLVTQITAISDIQYIIDVVDIYGCSATANVELSVLNSALFYVPNTFSPGNNDGVNDRFTLYTNLPDAEIVTMKIFDRWGAIVFEKNDFLPNEPSLGWDGSFNGTMLNPGVFVYAIELRLKDGYVQALKGDVTIIR